MYFLSWEGRGGGEELRKQKFVVAQDRKCEKFIFLFLLYRPTALCSGLTGDLSQKLKELP